MFAENSWKRWAALVCAIVLLLTMIPLAALATSGTVNTKSLILRKGASKSTKAIQTLRKGTELTILESKGDWYKVSYGKQTGYVMKKYVTVSGNSSSSGSSVGAPVSRTSGTVKAKLGSAPRATGKGDSGSAVKKLQQGLSLLGYYSGSIDGDYGAGTEKAVKKFQKARSLKQTGTADSKTIAAIWSSKVSSSASSSSSSSSKKLTTERLSWFKNGPSRIPKGAVMTVKDCRTGKTFKVRRWSGANHADCEPLTSSDTRIIKSVYGGFSWRRRAILVKYNGHVYAASMNFYPHGTQTIKNNGFDGHFCIHFYGSKTHGTHRVDSDHQNAVAQAMKYSW